MQKAGVRAFGGGNYSRNFKFRSHLADDLDSADLPGREPFEIGLANEQDRNCAKSTARRSDPDGDLGPVSYCDALS
jgi:hypothetical protein